MRVLIYAHRSKTAEAEAMAAALRQECKTVLYRDSRGFNGDIEACDRVLTDDPHIADAHAARGIEVQPYTAKQAPAAGGGDPKPEVKEAPKPKQRTRRKR